MNTSVDTVEISDPKALPDKPLVSVYTLTYNHEKFIADAIEGVIAQRCSFPIELIIGEDCSSDGTRDIVLDYQRRYPHLIRVLTAEQNVGAKANAARCQTATRGEFVAICEGDDYWTDASKLTRQVELMHKRPNVVLTCHAANIVDAISGSKLRVHRSASKSRLLSNPEIILGDGHLVPTCSILVRKEMVVERPSWWKDAPVGDYPMVLRAIQLGDVAYQDRVMSTYRLNVPGSWTTSQQPDTMHRYQHASAMAKVLQAYKNEMHDCYKAEINEAISKFLFDALIRSRGKHSLKKKLFSQVSASLNSTDRFLARLSLVSGRNLGLLRDIRTSIRGHIRGLVDNFTQPRC
jgi:glycosyltransferase involved in cell wall biosynthesis